jgi:D-alanyl-D-alanine carboxypeptidase
MVPVVSHNRLLASYEGARGGKTGFTNKARRCFVGEVDRGGVRLIVAILNSPNSGTLWQDARNLLDYGFARYGLAPPPPVKPEPLPVMVRRTPATPAAAQVAAVRSVLRKNQRAQVVRVKPNVRQPVEKVAVTKPGAKSKPTVVAATAKKPLKNPPVAKTTVKRSKPVPVVKVDAKRPVTKVARAEPAAVPKQKTSKRGG